MDIFTFEQVLALPVKETIINKRRGFVAVKQFCGCDKDVYVSTGYIYGVLYLWEKHRIKIDNISFDVCDYCNYEEDKASYPNLPDLYGTEKQIQWAQALRIKNIKLDEEVLKLVPALTEASAWIDFKDVLSELSKDLTRAIELNTAIRIKRESK